MKLVRTINEAYHQINEWKASKQSVGFVPTMGFLHEGHESLLKQAKEENDRVIMSIFVNPLQFNNQQDLSTYPRDEKRDLLKAQSNGVDLIFMPSAEEMYPKASSMLVTVQSRHQVLCGKSRPGHFDGVVTVLTKLFHICQPTKVYFGQKDAQQLAIVDGLIQDFNFPITLKAVSTVREADGLAKSSRNIHLTREEREEAPSIYQALLFGQSLVEKGCTDVEEILHKTRAFLETKTRGKIDYMELLTYPELESKAKVQGKMILATAVYYEKARLIDNIIIHVDNGGSDKL